MGERSRNILVGLTATGGIVALAYLLVIFGEVPNWLSDTYPVRVALDDATGLAQGSRVRLNGIDIGFVDS
ncbi:MAG: MlaD family protein, partial [Phycisphaerae bacterium]|nr:MlaD family protein [Phycisphaerae bacterium]